MATPKTPVWKGFQSGIVETPSSPVETVDATKSAITRIWEGPYAFCESQTPTIGQAFSDLPGDVLVVGTECAKLPGGKGRLTVNFETPYATTYECEWVEVDKALIQHPRYWSTQVGDTSNGVMSLTLQDRCMIERWEQEDDPAYKLQFQFKVLQASASTTIGSGPAGTPVQTNVSIAGYGGSFNIYQLSSNAQDYATKRLKGEEVYRLWAPVVRQTSESIDPPSTTPCGTIVQPPTDAGDIIPTGYVFQKSSARVVRTGPYGKYRLQAEWQGAEQIDTDLYPTGT